MTYQTKLLLIFLPLTLLFYACGTTDTVTVVQETPRTETTEEEEVEEAFYEITLGLIDPVTNFDPLFARNLSTQRILSLIYEGLFSLDNNGEPVPAIARDVEISDDEQTYTFTIDRERFFHESRIFTAGIGRRIHASDVKWALERTALSNVPPRAAELLMNISGFENFYLEQRNVYDIENRVLTGVVGIEVPDAQTVRIHLNEPDPYFLKKLASPNLFIYPREAVTNNPNGIENSPVGTGPYTFNRVDSDGRIILVRNGNRGEADLPKINRINAISFSSETEMLQQFARGDIDWLPEIGPDIIAQTITEDYGLQAAYRDSYRVAVHDAERINAFYLNERSVVDQRWLKSRLALLTLEDFLSRGEITIQTDRFEFDEDAEIREQYYLSFTDDLFAKSILTELHSLVFQPESSLVFFDIRVPTRQTSIFSVESTSYRQQFDPLPANHWLRIDTKIVSLYNPRISGVETSMAPWALNIHNIEVRDRDLSSAE